MQTEEIKDEFRAIISHALLGCDTPEVSKETWELVFSECAKYALQVAGNPVEEEEDDSVKIIAKYWLQEHLAEYVLKIADKHCIDNTDGEYIFHKESLIDFAKAYALQFGREIAEKSWDSAINHIEEQDKYPYGTRNGVYQYPNKQQYLTSLNLPQQQGWQDISTAPKDGTHIVIGHPDYDSFPVAAWEYVGEDEGAGYCWVSKDQHWWEDGVLWGDLGYIEPTHWMPLPVNPLTIKK